MAKPCLYLGGSARPERTALLSAAHEPGSLQLEFSSAPLLTPRSSFWIQSPCCGRSGLPACRYDHATPLLRTCQQFLIVPRRKSGLLSMVDQTPHNQVQAHPLGFLYHCSWPLPCLVPSISTELLVVPRVPWGSSCLPDFAYAVPSI